MMSHRPYCYVDTMTPYIYSLPSYHAVNIYVDNCQLVGCQLMREVTGARVLINLQQLPIGYYDVRGLVNGMSGTFVPC